MSTLVENTLSGEPGAQVTDATLAATAEVGTVTITAPGARAVYDDTHTVHDAPMVRIDSGHHRGNTPGLEVALPSAPWSARWYTRLPTTQAAGYGADEVRIATAFGDESSLYAYETTYGNAYTRRIGSDLAAAPVAPAGDGAAVPIDQLLRWEMRCDGTDIEIRVYPGHTTGDHRVMTYTGWDPSGTLSLTGFRYRIRTTLRLGDQGTDVTDLQNELIDLGYDLSPWGADGDFGTVTQDAVMDAQTDYGLSPVDGEAGPETRAAIDLALGRIPDPLWLSHLAIADGAWIGPAEAPPEPAPLARLRVGLPI